VALYQARISTKSLWGFSSSNPYPTQSRAEHILFSGFKNTYKKIRETRKLECIHEYNFIELKTRVENQTKT
jgi:hypothetical protein